jgi:hypothetical protein
VYGRSDAQSPAWLCRAGPALGLIALIALFLIERALWPAAGPGPNSIDLRFQYFPFYEVSFDALAAGRLPLWNPYHMAGLPWLATLQSGFFYPPHVLFLWLPSGVALALLHAFHLALIAIATSAFARRAGLTAPAATLAAIAFALCGTLQWWLFWPNMVEAGAWLPVGCIGVLDLARRRLARGACWLAFATAMSLLAGHSQVTVFVLYGWASLLAALLIGARSPVREVGLALGVFGGALALGLLLSAIQSLPTLDLTLEATRATGGLSEERASSVGIEKIASLGEAMAGSRFSFGAFALALAPAALFVRRRRTLALWALALGVATYLLAFGSGTSLMKVYLGLPGIGWFRQPHRLQLLTHFSVALLAGVALDGFGLAVAALLEGAFGTAARAALAALVVGLLARTSAGLPRALAIAAVLTAAAADMLLAIPLREPLPYSARWAAPYRERSDFYHNLARVTGENRFGWLFYRDPNTKLAPRYRLRRIDDWEPLHLRRQFEYFAFLRHGLIEHPQEPLFFAGDILPARHPAVDDLVEWYDQIATRRRLLDLAAVRWLAVRRALGPAEAEASRRFIEKAGLTPREFAHREVVLYENQNALPRAFVTYRTAPAPPREQLLDRISRESFDPMAESYVEGDPGFTPLAGTPERGGPAMLTRDDETVVEVEASLAAPGLVVLADAYARGWRAQVDGEPAPILPTNHLFRGVPVPAGHHRIRFEYRPVAVLAGAVATLLGAAVWGLLALRARAADRGTA